MSSSDCTSSSESPPSSSIHKSGAAPTPPPPPFLGSLLTDKDNDAMSDEYPEHDTSDELVDEIGQRSATSRENMQSKEQSVRTSESTTSNLPPDSSDASTSESDSLANKEDELPIAGTSFPRGGIVAANIGLRRIDPKSKKLLKSKMVSVRKSQLTPRMALYIPPHLQKQTQHVTSAAKQAVSSPFVALTPQQKKREKELNEKLKLVAKDYQLKQYNIFSRILTITADQNALPESSRNRNAERPLPAKLWTTEMEGLLLTRNTSREKFIELGEEDKLKESKIAKMKLRKMLRKVRSKPVAPKNPYKILERAHEEYEKSEAYKKIKGSKVYEDRKSRSSGISVGSTSFEMSHDVEVSLEPEYDSSFFLSLSQRHEARMEWSEAILEFNSSPANRLRSLPEIVKVEVIDSDEESVQNESPTRGKSSSASEKNLKRYGKFDSSGRSQNAATPRNSKQSVTSSTTQGSLDVSNNEYLNQQFLRRQHDYEREQKYQQIELASESNEFLRGSSENLFRGRDTMDDPLRLQPPVSPFPPMFGISVHPNSLSLPPVFPIPNVYSPGRSLPEREPEEPFVGERRRRRPHPAIVSPMLLGCGEPPSVKELVVDMHVRNHSKVRRPRSFSPGSVDPIREINGSHITEIGRNPTLFRSSRESSPVVRNYSNERVPNREYPPSRPLSPFSERIIRAAEKDSRRTTSHDGRERGRENSRQLSPFSERMRIRESSARRLSPFSERMRSRENIDRHNSPGREGNCRPEVGHYLLHKSIPHHGGRELFSDRSDSDRTKFISRHAISSDNPRFPDEGVLGKRGEIHQRGSHSNNRHEAQRNSHRRGRELLTRHVSQCPRFALQTKPADTRKDSSSRRRESDRTVHSASDSRMVREKLSKRNYETGDSIDSRKHSEIRKRTRSESSSGPYPSSVKRPRR